MGGDRAGAAWAGEAVKVSSAVGEESQFLCGRGFCAALGPWSPLLAHSAPGLLYLPSCTSAVPPTYPELAAF